MTATTVPATPVHLDLGLYPEIQKFGAADISACFSCGTCSATCPMSQTDGTFPRRIIRYAQLGMKEQLLSSKELWTCYQCGECAESCPTKADPSEFMAATRRYAIASYDKTRLARSMYSSPIGATLVAVVVALFFALFFLSSRGAMSADKFLLWQFIPEELVHNTGIVVMVLVFIAGIVGLGSMVRDVGAREGVSVKDALGSRAGLARSVRALWYAIGIESFGQVRFRADCKAEDAAKAVPWYRGRAVVHMLVVWGFMGLFAATLLDYGTALIGLKATGAEVPLWYPIRLLGTVAGAALLYGTSVLIVDRYRKANRSVTSSTTADWMLLALLWIVAVTGFAIELALYIPGAPVWGYWLFVVHVSVAMELILLAPFMKLAHVIYRPAALYFVGLAAQRNKEA
jgi:ferredoxin